jgi:hypothetical protein
MQVRPLRLALVPCLLATLLAAPGARAAEPKSAAAFRDSIGVSTHIVYYSTAYGNWPLLVDRLRELGVRHLRDGTYANPEPQWRAWNERYYRAVEYAADHGLRFNFGLGNPGYEAGTLDQLIAVVAGRLRRAAEAVEGPNEFDKFVGGPRWASRLRSYGRDLYRKVKANPSLRSLPVVGPSLSERDGPLKVGDQSAWLDRGNIHPYAGGASPNPLWIAAERDRISHLSGSKPVWATEAGFHNAVNARTGMPPTSEAAGAIYVLRTVLEHFKSGIARTYLYELVDLYPDPGATNPNWSFGLLRNDYSRKPAFTALRNLLALVGEAEGNPRLTPLRLELSGRDAGVRRLVLQRADGSYAVVLWRLSSVWDRDRRRPVRVPRRRVELGLPGAARVGVADPLRSDGFRRLRLRRGRVQVRLAGRPLVLEVVPKRRLSASR